VRRKVNEACRLKKRANWIQEIYSKSIHTVDDLEFLNRETEHLDPAAEILGMNSGELKALLNRGKDDLITLKPSQDGLEILLRSSILEEAEAEAELRLLLETLAEEMPARFYPWIRTAGLEGPSLLQRLAALQETQETLAQMEGS